MPANAIVAANIAASTSGIEEGYDEVGKGNPRLANADPVPTMAMASCKAPPRSRPPRCSTATGWSAKESVGLDPNGQVGLDLGYGVLDVASEGEDIAARPHGDRETNGLPRPLTWKIGCSRAGPGRG